MDLEKTSFVAIRCFVSKVCIEKKLFDQLGQSTMSMNIFVWQTYFIEMLQMQVHTNLYPESSGSLDSGWLPGETGEFKLNFVDRLPHNLLHCFTAELPR